VPVRRVESPSKPNYISDPLYYCHTIWFASRYNEIKGKTLKMKISTIDLMACLKLHNKKEMVNSDAVYIKE
jgi:hypothetical protein